MSGFKPRMVKVALYQGDYQQRVAEAAKAVEDAKKRAKDGAALPRLMGEVSEVEQLTEAHNALVAEAEAEGCLVVSLRALGRKTWSTMVSQHPPRTGEGHKEDDIKSDAEVGVNEETFSEVLVPAAIASLSDPEQSVPDLLENISSMQFTELYINAFALNRDVGYRPKVLPSITPSPSSGETSN